MDKKEIPEKICDPGYIPGIYNYCDRWCERCRFTSRCLSCTLAEEDFGDLEATDLQNEEFWEIFSEVLQTTLSMVKEMAAEEGIDLEAVIAGQTDDEAGEQHAIKDLLTHMSKNYAKAVADWFHAREQMFHDRELEMSRIRLIGRKDDPAREAAGISDSVEVIRWYQLQIYGKIQRALKSCAQEELEDDDSPRDSDGSAKVALIGIDRSIAAWRILLFYFPAHKHQIVSLIGLLEDIRRRVEIRFPGARDFVRPGFDEGV